MWWSPLVKHFSILNSAWVSVLASADCVLGWPTGTLLVFTKGCVFPYSLCCWLLAVQNQKCHPVKLCGKKNLQSTVREYNEKPFLLKDRQALGRLPCKDVQVPSLDVFKSQLDTALSNLARNQCWHFSGQGIALETFWSPFQPDGS